MICIWGGVIIVSIIGIIQWLLTMWIKSRLENSIKHEYDKILEEFKFSIRQREQAAAIAKLFARWIKYNGKEDVLLKENEKRDHFEEMNKLNWELAIWMPDEKIVKKINNRLTNKGGEDIRSLILEVRTLILGKKSDDLKWSELTYFSA